LSSLKGKCSLYKNFSDIKTQILGHISGRGKKLIKSIKQKIKHKTKFLKQINTNKEFKLKIRAD